MSSRQAKHARRKASELAEVGSLPAIADPGRRRLCGQSLALFLTTYFPHSTGKNLLSPAHLRVIDRMERCIMHGGRSLNAVFRGFAKTTITENSALWAVLYGYRRYVAVMAAIYDQAQDLVESITREIETNELLLEDFPEVCIPFLKLEGKPQRCRSQTHNGQPTYIGMSGGTLILPTIYDSTGLPLPHSAAVIRASGLFPPRRGMKFKRPDGENARPDFAILDDFQTDESAANPDQVAKLIKRIYKAVLNSAGHGEELGCIINATPIEPNDAVEQLLDHTQHPSFMGERVPMVMSWAKRHEEWWLAKYRLTRHAYDPTVAESQAAAQAAANALYAAEQARADEGCRVAWPHIPLRPGEISAIQHAYNMLLDNGAEVFATECQMEAAAARPAAIEPLTARDIAARVNGLKRGQLPELASFLTAGIDVHDDILYWVLVAWSLSCQGWVLDYGTWPKQTSRYFAKRNAKQTLRQAFPRLAVESAVQQGLEALLGELRPRLQALPYRVGIDVGYRPEAVLQTLRILKDPCLLPLRGAGIKADQTQVRDYERRKGWTIGEDWWIPQQPQKPKTVWLDDDLWKTWLWSRWTVPIGLDGALSLFGKRGEDHRLISEHCVAEIPTEQPGRKGITKILWTPANRSVDNHYLDCLKMAGVLASLQGARVGPGGPGGLPPSTSQRRRRALAAAERLGLLSDE